MGYLLYNVFLLLASPIIVCILLAKKRCRPGLWYRLGKLPKFLGVGNSSRIWVHAASLGEVMTVTPLIRELHHRFPHLSIVVSTVTETGREAVKQQLAGIAEHCYLPLDFPWMVRRVIQFIHPSVCIVVETEIWPNLLQHLQQANIPAVMVNGRISSKSFRRYRSIRWFIGDVLRRFSLCLMQSERDVQRMITLGADPGRVHHTGNMKFGQARDSDNQTSMDPAAIGASECERILVAGSTHAEEDNLLLETYQAICQNHLDVVLLIAPRHLDRIHQLETKIHDRGVPVVRHSRIESEQSNGCQPKGHRVIILDSHGELAKVYALGYGAFVGGTLVPVGGHNLLEPAYWGKPVIFGPFTDHCEDLANLLIQSGGGIRVRDGKELTEVCLKGLRDPDWFDKMGKAARKMVDIHQDVVERNLNMLSSFVDPR